MCEFQSLFFSDYGYIVKCKKCSHYQVAFASTILSLIEQEFNLFYKIVKGKNTEVEYCFDDNAKCITIPTPSHSVHILLTPNELSKLYLMVEEADNEATALSLISLFNT